MCGLPRREVPCKHGRLVQGLRIGYGFIGGGADELRPLSVGQVSGFRHVRAVRHVRHWHMDGGQGRCDGVCVDSYAGADEVPDGGAYDCTNGVPDSTAVAGADSLPDRFPDAVTHRFPNFRSFCSLRAG